MQKSTSLAPVAAYLTTDERANGIVFALYTSETPELGGARPHRATIAALTGVLAQEGISIRDGIYVTDTTYYPYDTSPGDNIAFAISTTEYSRVNAEFIYRGSTIAPTNQVTLPPATHKAEMRPASNATWKPSSTARQRLRPTKRTTFGTPCSPRTTIPPTMNS
ncbi:hypothetical protein ACFUOZ_01315 [Paenarthrobacter sp. NPDC057355]|uniref:hypothetical protein n=1 Tax=Paenarthrobacter sp. NPDC057355 TaxID=3346105 RepID=UPI00362C6E23